VSERIGLLIRTLLKMAAHRTLDVADFLAAMLAEHLAARGIDGRDPTALVVVSSEGGPLPARHFRRRVWAPALGPRGSTDKDSPSTISATHP